MKLKDPFTPIDDLRRRISAPKTNETFGYGPLGGIKRKLGKEGIEVGIHDLEDTRPFLTYKRFLIVAYILRPYANKEELLSGRPGSPAPKFHFTRCITLEQMNASGRIERYVASSSKTGLFRVGAFDRDRNEWDMFENVRLFPCQNCLSKINYRGFDIKDRREDRLKKVSEFSIDEYFEENEGTLTTIIFFLTSIKENFRRGGTYNDTFPETSRRLREEAGWRCSKCAVDMTGKKQGLHVHHRNGVKDDDSRSNLQVLCAECHQQIDQYHKRMHVEKNIIRYIRRNRPKSRGS